MQIEKLKLQLAPFQVMQTGTSYRVQFFSTFADLSQDEYRYFDQLIHGLTLEQLVDHFLKQGWLIRFGLLFDLLHRLTTQGLILNPDFHRYFQEVLPSPQQQKSRDWSPTSSSLSTGGNLSDLPFFRSLPAQVRQLFESRSQKFKVSEGQRLCQAGTLSRDMFVLNSGLVGIYRVTGPTQRQLLTALPSGAIFGEGGFFLGKPRMADIVTLQPCEVTLIKYDESIFGPLIQAGKAQALQERFWVLSGLMSSPLFQHIPTETFDQLIFSGKTRAIKEGEILVREGEPGRSFFIIVQGSVVFSRNRQPLRVLNQGEVFGEVALMVSGGIRTATAQAQRDGLILEIGMEEFYKILAQHLFLAKELEQTAWQRWQK